ncbi:MAG: peptidylprolyl isomerase [Deltaproteobacteria bacterium]|nr:peptidylprolyl isomerase [Deltaproteobacteria bacterium]NIS77273.1 peptidylprolyl isomerase [Deltaproteobacteria bacterium]
MPKAKNGDAATVHYTGSLDDGTVFDSSKDREPLQFVIGEGTLIPGFEEAVIGMAPGDTKKVTLSADEAYGPHRAELTVQVEKKQFPPDINPQVGQHLQIPQPDGQVVNVRVTGLDDASVTLDANHPLAGEDLTFQIDLLELK